MTIKQIQQNLKNNRLDAEIITLNNHFPEQDIRDEENKIKELTGFSGSAGMLIITPNKAHLFVDGRYELQSLQQTNPKQVEVICKKDVSIPTAVSGWIKKQLPENAAIAYNPWCLTVEMADNLQRWLPHAVFLAHPQLMPTAAARVFKLPLKYSGQNTEQKLQSIGEYLKRRGCTAFFTAAADSVSWLLNLRSDALPNSPVLRAMALVTAEGQYKLFGENIVLPKDCPYRFLPFSAIEEEIAALSQQKWLINRNTPAAIRDIMKKHDITPRLSYDPCQELKSIKNKVEIRGFKKAHIRDGVAVCRFLCWLGQNRKPISEWQIVEKLRYFREQQPLFYSDSFATIAGSGPNAAIVHYQPTAENNSLLIKNSVLLLDSGAQYFDGTTDITRTIAIGNPEKEIVKNYTIVLKAHIALASLIFPDNVSGTRMDTVCRSVMWRYKMDYSHGTGHGVGHFLNVHEDPNNLSWYGSFLPLLPNMVTSVEPGYYKAGCYGIRIENLMYVTPLSNSDMLKFEFLTLVPLDKRLIDKYLLTSEELAWVNGYHQKVYQKIAPHLSDPKEKLWLQKACSPL